jgi:beta-1,4-mannosyl-glycoprotein beta-1,4-N-acetylglucosaminyltransferase
MIVDCFPFANELNLLDARLQMLSDQVDFFLIQEVAETHAGLPKKIQLSLDSWPLENYRGKIVLIQEQSFPGGLQPFAREWWQRDMATSWLNKNMSDSDILIYGDVDEIPDPTKLPTVIEKVLQENRPAFLAMEMHYCFLNYRERTGRLLSNLGDFPRSTRHRARWLGTVVWPWKKAKTKLPSQLRTGRFVDLGSGFRQDVSGWHFSYVDSPGADGFERFIAKLAISAHQEFNNERVKDAFWRRITRGLDPLGRRWVRFEIMESLSELPEVIQNLGRLKPELLLDRNKIPAIHKNLGTLNRYEDFRN